MTERARRAANDNLWSEGTTKVEGIASLKKNAYKGCYISFLVHLLPPDCLNLTMLRPDLKKKNKIYNIFMIYQNLKPIGL